MAKKPQHRMKGLLDKETAERIVSTLLGHSRLHPGRLPFPRDPFTLQQVIEALLERLKPKLAGQSRTLLWLMALAEPPGPPPGPSELTAVSALKYLETLRSSPAPKKDHDDSVMAFQRIVIHQYLKQYQYPESGFIGDKEKWLEKHGWILVNTVMPLTLLCHCGVQSLIPRYGLLERMVRGEAEPATRFQRWNKKWKAAAYENGLDNLTFQIIANLHMTRPL